MSRALQHASLAINSDDDASSSLFPYLIGALTGLMCVVLIAQHGYSWVCKVCFGRVKPEVPMTGEEIIESLTEEQRRAVIQAILSKLCKAATEDDVTMRKDDDEKLEKGLPVVGIDLPIAQAEVVEIRSKNNPDKEYLVDEENQGDSDGNCKQPTADRSETKDPNLEQPVDDEEVEDDETEVRPTNSDIGIKTSHSSESLPRLNPSASSADIEQGDVASPASTDEEQASDTKPSAVVPKEPEENEQACDTKLSAVMLKESAENEQPNDIEAGTVLPTGSADDDQSCDIEQGVVESDDSSDKKPAPCPLLCQEIHTPLVQPCARRPSLSASLCDEDSLSDGDVCSICLGHFEKGDMLFTSKHCSHVFHGDCILEWLTKREDCPICRVQMVTQDELVAVAVDFVEKTTKPREY